MDSPSFFDSSREHFIFTLFPTMPLSVSDRVMSSAALYDQGTEDENGLTFSQRQLGKGLGRFVSGQSRLCTGKKGGKFRNTGLGGMMGPFLRCCMIFSSLLVSRQRQRQEGWGRDLTPMD
jgi:hypothetical protein